MPVVFAGTLQLLHSMIRRYFRQLQRLAKMKNTFHFGRYTGRRLLCQTFRDSHYLSASTIHLQQLRLYIERFMDLPRHDWELFAGYLHERRFNKKTQILHVGMVENYLSFIASGITRHYTEEGEKDITFEIGFANSFGTAYDSFVTQQPCTYQVEALTDVVQWSISYADLQHVYANSSTGDRIGRLSAEELFIRKSKRQLSLLTDTAEQRYRSLVMEQPHLLQYIPLKYLASYIGITPQALSRIRRRIS